MVEFRDIQQNLEAARKGAYDISRQLFKERQRLQRCKRDRKRLERFVDQPPPPGGTAGVPELEAIDEKISGLNTRINGLMSDLTAARDVEVNHLARFIDFSDPREHIGHLSDAVPILLMPLRIETRFKPGNETDGRSGELWVRVYPDDIAIDVFEDTLSEGEVIRLQKYWVNIWRAGGVEAEERGAWKALVGSHGSGRSYWMVEQYRPLNETEQPIKDPDTPTVILVIPTQQPLLDPERTTVSQFWEALWRAGDDAGTQQAALDGLVAEVGADRAAEIQRDYAPANLADGPPAGIDRSDVTVVAVFVEFPPDDALPMREGGWAQAPHVNVMPERLVLIGYSRGEKTIEVLGNPIPSPLVVGPDPSAEEENQVVPDGDDIRVGEEMAWVVDFEKAISAGMGFRIPLTPTQFRLGFDQLLVLGVRLRADEEGGRTTLEDLITHHHRSRAGFSILPQGRPTNNVEGEGSDYSWREDADVSFDHYFASGNPDDPEGWFEKRDGRWLAECLGLQAETLKSIPHYHRKDLCEARAMNVALWPATLGYFMESMMDPVFDEATVKRARSFFTRHVCARGMVPAIRIGKQPYGILPATPRSRMNWLFPRQTETSTAAPLPPDEDTRFHQQLYRLLQKVESDWSELSEKVSHIGKPGDQHQILLDVVGFHSGSVEHHQRYAESMLQLYNRMALQGAAGAFLAALIGLGYIKSGLDLLDAFGYAHNDDQDIPDVLEKLFLKTPHLLKGPLIDDRPLSEVEPIRPYTEAGLNYIQWLINAAETSHNALRVQEGFIDEKPPTALLYLMLHHGLDLSFVQTSLHLFLSAGILTEPQVSAARREARFIHVQEKELVEPTSAGASRWQYLYRSDPEITGDPGQTVGEFIPTVLTTMAATGYLNRQLAALRHLEGASTASLERVFSEHLDLCSYRLDAWFGGLMSHQLSLMRYPTDADGENIVRGGIYLGAYGWLENVRPEHKVMTPVELDSEMAAIFDRPGDPPLTSDPANAGYIHAPSLNHAVTAAVLRNGYLSNATPDNPGSLAINLSSERVRLALQVIEGMQGGQSLAALLGYRFERGLHDRHNVEVDAFIYDLRKAFPLYADRFSTTKTGKTDESGKTISIRKIEARNVIDGLSLVEHMNQTGNTQYPFGLDDLPPAAPGEAQAISEEAQRIVNIADAVADLVMAESVHQVVQGNYDRAGAVLDTYSKGKFPATPDVVKTPRSGVTLNHRVGLHLEPGLAPNDPANTSPRAKAEPAINKWLAQHLPLPDKVACVVTVIDPLEDTATDHIVRQSDLGLTPIDLLYVVDPDRRKAMKALDDVIEHHIITTLNPRPLVEISVRYRQKVADIDGHVSFFELAAMIRSLRSLLLRSRPLRATDMSITHEAREADDVDVVLNADRVTLIRDELAGHLVNLTALQSALQTRIDNEQHTDIIDDIDLSISGFAGLVMNISPFAQPEAGIGSVFDDKRRIFKRLIGKLSEMIDRWEEKLSRFDGAIADYDDLPAEAGDAQKFLDLQKAERFITTAPTGTLPADPDDFRDDLVNTSRLQFANQLENIKSLHDTSTSLSDLYNGIEGSKSSNALFDPTEIDLEKEKDRLLAVAEDIAARSAFLVKDVEGIIKKASGRIDTHDAAVQSQEKVDALIAAGKALLGDNFQMVPEFGLPGEQADEWGNAWGPGASADRRILQYLENDLSVRFPVDDWLYGISRVREKMHHLENAMLLGEVFSGVGIPLQPLQFPHRPGDDWLALDFPEKQQNGVDDVGIDEDKLLYTAHYAVPFNKSAPQCGLLLDEWTEVIPSKSEETGLTFHYDRPNSEPPQVLMLAMPSQFVGAWRWQDLVDTIHETMELAKKRAIEPDHIDTTAYARFLPAIISAVTLHPITASLNLAFNNDLVSTLAAAGGSGDE